MLIPFESSAAVTNRVEQFSRCSKCSGRGELTRWVICKTCGGNGICVTEAFSDLRNNRHLNRTAPCSACRKLGGRNGYVQAPKTCEVCDGTGKISNGFKTVVEYTPEEKKEMALKRREQEIRKRKAYEIRKRKAYENKCKLDDMARRIRELTERLDKYRREHDSSTMDMRIELSEEINKQIKEYNEFAKSIGMPAYCKKQK